MNYYVNTLRCFGGIFKYENIFTFLIKLKKNWIETTQFVASHTIKQNEEEELPSLVPFQDTEFEKSRVKKNKQKANTKWKKIIISAKQPTHGVLYRGKFQTELTSLSSLSILCCIETLSFSMKLYGCVYVCEECEHWKPNDCC